VVVDNKGIVSDAETPMVNTMTDEPSKTVAAQHGLGVWSSVWAQIFSKNVLLFLS